MTVMDEQVILANLHTNQSGILGIIRQLHNFGFVLLALITNQTIPFP